MVEVKELTFQSIPQNIAIVEKLIDELCEEHNITEENYGNILISLTEGVNNAIVHGNKLDEDKKVNLKFYTDDKTLKVTIEDEGPGFDYDNLPDPTSPENIEKPHGRGVFLMRNLADNCVFSDDGKLVSLEFNAIGA